MNNINPNLNSLINSDLVPKQQPSLKKTKETSDVKDVSSLINEAVSDDETLELGLKKIVNKLLDGIKASKDLDILSKGAKDVNISKNLAQDIKDLSKILSKDNDLKPLATKLEALLDTKLNDAKALTTALNNSGVFLESKLRVNLNNEALPPSFFRLISFTKNIKNKELKKEIFKLGQEQNSEQSLKKLDEFINTKLNKTNFPPNIKTLDFLKNARAYLQKTQDPIKLITVADKLEQKINKEIKNLLSTEIKNDKIKSIIPRLASLKASIDDIKNLAQEIIKNPSNVSKGENYKEINNEANLANKLKNFKELLSNPTLGNANEIKENNETLIKQEIINDNKTEIKAENQTKEVKNENIKENTKENIKENITENENIKTTIKDTPKQEVNTNQDEIKIIKESIKLNQELSKTKDINNEIKILNNPEIKAAIMQNQSISNILNNENLSLQNKIQNMTRLLSANLKNEESFKNYVANNEIKGLKHHINQAKRDVNQIVARSNEHINKSLSMDAKALLLQTSQAALNKNDKVAYDLSQKMLNQIELNQLISVANSEVNTYLPYSIDDLDESSVSFKSDSEDRFYAQIKLKFKKLGNINILLGLNQDKYLDINMMIENDDFRKVLIDNAKDFKNNLRNINLICSNFFISKLVEQKYEDNYQLDLGFDKKV